MRILEKIKRHLKKGKRAAIFFHVNPEGDSLGSALALAEILRGRGLEVAIFSYDGVPRVYRFLPGVAEIKKTLPDFSRFDLAFVVDCGDLKRVGFDPVALRKIPVLINIDHHSDNQQFGDLNFTVEAAAVGEQIFHLARFLKYPLTRNLAINLYVAIVTDTGGFRFSNTTESTFLIAAELLRYGVPIEKINRQLFENKTEGFLKALSLVLGRARVVNGGRLLWSYLTYWEMKVLDTKEDELNELVDYFKLLGTARAMVFFREVRPGLVKINFRSKEKFDVQKIARVFGGGGHKKAAGALVKGDLKSICQKVIARVKRK